MGPGLFLLLASAERRSRLERFAGDLYSLMSQLWLCAMTGNK